MTLLEEAVSFEKKCRIIEGALLHFSGVGELDVYNPSIPFSRNGKNYLFGRVEKRSEWGNSTIRLFREAAPDSWHLVRGAMIYQLEDPFITKIGDEFLLGGVQVQKSRGKLETYRTCFMRGKDPFDLTYFTTGPDFMKDIRLCELPGGKIGVFSRPRNDKIKKKFGSESQIGFTTITDLNELCAEIVSNAPCIPGFFGPGEWGGCNQAIPLDDGSIGIIGHLSCNYGNAIDGHQQQRYINTAWIFDPNSHKLKEKKIIGTRKCYPDAPAKRAWLTDVAFSSGIILNGNGTADLYSGLGDACAGRITIADPFMKRS